MPPLKSGLAAPSRAKKYVGGLKLLATQYESQNSSKFFLRGRHFEPADDVLGLVVREKWRQRDPNCLWWTCMTQKIGAKSVVRSWLSRRFKVALKEVFEQAGYDRDGRALKDGSQNLRGCLKMFPTRASITANFEDIKTELKEVLNLVERYSK